MQALVGRVRCFFNKYKFWFFNWPRPLVLRVHVSAYVAHKIFIDNCPPVCYFIGIILHVKEQPPFSIKHFYLVLQLAVEIPEGVKPLRTSQLLIRVVFFLTDHIGILFVSNVDLLFGVPLYIVTYVVGSYLRYLC